MKLKRILNIDAIQAYTIVSPTKRIKAMFPYKYIFVLNFKGKTIFGNTNVIPQQFYFMPMIGYIFTYEKTLPDVIKSNRYMSYTNYGHTHPVGLDQFFINNGSDNVICDLVLSCTATNESMPVQMCENIIIRCNSHQLVNNETKDVEIMSKNIKSNIKKIINTMLKKVSPTNVEEWLLNIIEHSPFNDNDMPYKYYDNITDALFKSKTVTLNNKQISIGYDLRADDYEFENKFIHALELSFEDKKHEVIVYDTYNGLMKRVMSAFDKNNFKYEKITDHSIKVEIGNLWKCSDEIDLQITDLI